MTLAPTFNVPSNPTNKYGWWNDPSVTDLDVAKAMTPKFDIPMVPMNNMMLGMGNSFGMNANNMMFSMDPSMLGSLAGKYLPMFPPPITAYEPKQRTRPDVDPYFYRDF